MAGGCWAGCQLRNEFGDGGEGDAEGFESVVGGPDGVGDAATGTQHALGFSEDGGGVDGVVEAEADGDGVERCIGMGHRGGVADIDGDAGVPAGVRSPPWQE